MSKFPLEAKYMKAPGSHTERQMTTNNLDCGRSKSKFGTNLLPIETARVYKAVGDVIADALADYVCTYAFRALKALQDR
jgi:hypothetical protein